jgi:hypothetical protein
MNRMGGKRRRSDILIAYECKQIRSLIFEGRSNRDIMELLNLKPRTFYRYLEKIRKEDYFDLMTDRKGSLAIAVNLTRDRLSRILDRLETIANNGTAENPMGCTPNEMTNASSQASMVTLALSKLEVEGPTIVHTDKLHEIMSSEQKATLDESNIQTLRKNSQNNSNDNRSTISR